MVFLEATDTNWTRSWTDFGTFYSSMDEWEGRIAEKLQLTRPEIEAIKTKYPGELLLQTRAGLQKLQEKFGPVATYMKRDKRTIIGDMIGVVSFFLQLSTLVVLAMLLLLAGDVERNPGPIYELVKEDHYKVYQFINDTDDKHIIELGEALGLNYTTLKRMKDLPLDMVAAWIRAQDNVLAKSGRPSWNALVQALRRIGQDGIARRVGDEVGLLPLVTGASEGIGRGYTLKVHSVLRQLEETTTQLREELTRRDEAHQKDMIECDKAHRKELIARDELHKKEVERLIQSNKEKSRKRDETFRKDLCELKALVQQLVQTNKAESGPETLEENIVQSVPTLNEDHISEVVDDKSVIPAMPTRVEEARLEKLSDRDEVHKTEVKEEL